MEGRPLSLGWVFRPGMRGYFIPFVAGVTLTISAFLPWVVVSGVSRAGAPDAPGLWVAGLGVTSAVLAALSLVTRRNSRHPLLVVGLLALGIILLTWRIVPRLAGEEARTISQALAIVDDTPVRDIPAVPAALVGSGLYLAGVASMTLVAFGLTIVVRRARPYVVPDVDDDV
jgi:hypothetical protein